MFGLFRKPREILDVSKLNYNLTKDILELDSMKSPPVEKMFSIHEKILKRATKAGFLGYWRLEVENNGVVTYLSDNKKDISNANFPTMKYSLSRYSLASNLIVGLQTLHKEIWDKKYGGKRG